MAEGRAGDPKAVPQRGAARGMVCGFLLALARERDQSVSPSPSAARIQETLERRDGSAPDQGPSQGACGRQPARGVLGARFRPGALPSGHAEEAPGGTRASRSRGGKERFPLPTLRSPVTAWQP